MAHPETQVSLALPGDDSATAATEGQADDAPVTAAAVPQAPTPVRDMAPAGDDDEIREIFLEEARPVLATWRDNLAPWTHRKSVVSGKSVSVRVELGGRGDIKKKTNQVQNTTTYT